MYMSVQYNTHIFNAYVFKEDIFVHYTGLKFKTITQISQYVANL